MKNEHPKDHLREQKRTFVSNRMEVTSGKVWLLADRVKPLYPEVMRKRTLRLEDAHEDLGINIERDRLKF